MDSWCEHIKPEYDGKVLNFMGVHAGWPDQKGHWNFCPICGTSRPKEKTLAEKFYDHTNFCRAVNSVAFLDHLAYIATEHFKEHRP